MYQMDWTTQWAIPRPAYFRSNGTGLPGPTQGSGRPLLKPIDINVSLLWTSQT